MQPSITTLKKEDFKGLIPHNQETCTLELTVTTGFEEVAAQECREKLKVEPTAFLGRIVFDISIYDVSEVLKLRSIENVNIIISCEQKFPFTKSREQCFGKMYTHVMVPDFRKGLTVWELVFGDNVDGLFNDERKLEASFCRPKPEVDLKKMKSDSSISGNLPPELLTKLKEFANKSVTGDQNGANANDKKNADGSKIVDEKTRVGKGPTYRVSCHRVGTTHTFGSGEAARQFGGGINERFGWPVDLTNYKLEVLLNIIEDFVYSGISLTREPLYKRNITHFGPTTLRSTICYNMVKLAKLEPGDFVIDPMCGGSSINIEGALTHPYCFYLGGDNTQVATVRSVMNIEKLVEGKKDLPIDNIRWNAKLVPLRDQVVDVVLSDLPFGKRVGNKKENNNLYLKSLVDLARVTRVKTGRAVLLTYDKKAMTKALARVGTLWNNYSTRAINIGGLLGNVYLLERTARLKDQSVNDSLEPEEKIDPISLL